MAEDLPLSGALGREEDRSCVRFQSFSASRGFRQLSHQGLVADGGKGYVLVGISEEDIAEIFSLRLALEGMAVSLAVRKASPADDARLSGIVTDLKGAVTKKEGLRFARLGIDFHSVFYEVAASQPAHECVVAAGVFGQPSSRGEQHHQS